VECGGLPSAAAVDERKKKKKELGGISVIFVLAQTGARTRTGGGLRAEVVVKGVSLGGWKGAEGKGTGQNGWPGAGGGREGREGAGIGDGDGEGGQMLWFSVPDLMVG
jgi:hypothetical protein